MARGIEELGDELERRVRTAVPDVITEIRLAAEQVKAGAEAEWPVGRRWKDQSKPHSRDLFTLRTTRTGSASFTVTIRNSAGYLRMIKPKKLAEESGRAGQAYVKWLMDPMKAKRDGLVLVLAEHVVEGLRRG